MNLVSAKGFRSMILFLLIVFPSTGHAMTFREFLVGGAIKNMARIFIKTSNLEKLKTKYIKKIMTMQEDKFRKNYMKFYVVYKQLPATLQETYVFTESTTRSEIVGMIERVNKRDLLVIIDQVPSEFIVDQTRHYSRPKNNQQEPVDERYLWKRIIEKV